MIYYYPDRHVDVVQLDRVVAQQIAILVMHLLAANVLLNVHHYPSCWSSRAYSSTPPARSSSGGT
eukprot:5953602-Heterocapsa_arctica.AAC.1